MAICPYLALAGWTVVAGTFCVTSREKTPCESVALAGCVAVTIPLAHMITPPDTCMDSPHK